ncbi:MAG TPA: cupin domain-containing protein [Opitutaceae bacterium]|nr:cupin domain-containing protein [Opitutaceae bacterium]
MARTKCPTQQEMKARIARFKELKSTKSAHALAKGIPQEVLEMITAKSTFNIMSPENLGGTLSPKPPVVGGDAGVFRLGIATCPAGNGPGLHIHWRTHETFMALTGKWEIRWGDKGEETTLLEPFDLIAVPPGVTRQFINRSDKDAHLLVIIQGKLGEFDDVGRVPETAEAIAKKFGPDMVKKLETEGWQFTLQANAPVEEKA